MTGWPHRAFALMDVPLYLLLLSLRSVAIDAQSSFIPPPIRGSMSVFIEGKALYIQGGANRATDTIFNQTFFVDLSVSWPVSKPVYTLLPNGFPNAIQSPSALLKDGETWVSIVDSTINTYNVKTGTLEKKQTMASSDNFASTQAVTNPENGEVIAIRRNSGTSGVRETVYSDATTGLTVTAIAPPPHYTKYALYSMAWSNSHKAAFTFGGESDLAGFMNATWRLDGNTYTWTKLNTTGDVPPARDTSCMVAAQGGDKLVVFGGRVDLITQSDVYVFDIANNNWKRGKDGGPQREKSDHACAMSGTQLVSWGGIQGGDVMTAVYDIATDTWLDQYTAPPPTPKVSPDSETPTGPGSESTSNVAAIVGGVCGAIAVIAIIAGLLIYKRRRNNARLSQQDHHIIDKEPALKTAGYLLDGTRTNKQDHPKHSASKPGSPETCPGNIFTVASKEEASSENLFTVCSKEEGPRNPHTTTEEQQMQTTGAPHTNNDTNPRDPQHSHDAAADPPTSDEVRLQEKKLAERKALDQLIEAHRQEQIQIHLEVQRQKEDQDRKLQLLMKQRRAL